MKCLCTQHEHDVRARIQLMNSPQNKQKESKESRESVKHEIIPSEIHGEVVIAHLCLWTKLVNSAQGIRVVSFTQQIVIQTQTPDLR